MGLSAPSRQVARCTRYHYRYSGCSRCADACPHGALTLDDQGVTLDPARCRNCSLCASACRTGTFMAENPAPVEFLKAAIRAEPKDWAIACAPSGAEGDCRVPCLGGVDAVLLAYLAKRGIAVSLRGSTHCRDCEHGPAGAAQLALNLDTLAALKVAAGPEAWAPVSLPRDLPAAAPPDGFRAGRRQLFRRWIGRGVDEAGAALDDAAVPAPVVDRAIRASAPHVTERREILRIVAGRADGEAFLVAPDDGLPVLDLCLDQGCTACEACFRACPSAAITINESESSWALRFDVQRCVGCGVCLEVCQPRVLRAAPVADLSRAGPLALRRLAKQRCARCDRFFTSPEPRERCPVCEDDEEAFARIFG